MPEMSANMINDKNSTEQTDTEVKTSQGATMSAYHREYWLRAGAIWLLTVTALVMSFWPTVEAIVVTWWESATFNHCFLILPIIAYLVWERREVFARLLPAPSYWGLLCMGLASLLWLFGSVAEASVIKQFSLAFMLQASVLTVFGMAFARVMIFPIFFLLFAVPFGDFLVPKMQDITAVMTVWLLQVSGLAVYSDGVFISVPNGDFHVAEACSGVRFLIASITLGVLFANIAFISWRRRAIVILLSVIVPIVSNGFRAYGIIMIAYLTDNEYALGVDHLIYGWIFFAFVTLLFLSIGMSFMDRPVGSSVVDPDRLSTRSSGTSTFSLVAIAALAVLAANIGSSYAAYIDQRVPVGPVAQLSAPDVSGPWHKVDEVISRYEWKPEFRGVDAEIVQHYSRDDGATISLYLGYYKYQRTQAELVQFGNSVIAPDPWDWSSSAEVEADVDGKKMKVQAVTAVARYDQRRIWYWYWVNDRFTANKFKEKLLTSQAKLLGGPQDGAVIAISVGDIALNDHKDAVLQDFLNHLEPIQPGLSSLLVERNY